jgi:hypothetical protein
MAMAFRAINSILYKTGLHRNPLIYRIILYWHFDPEFYSRTYERSGTARSLFADYLRTVREEHRSLNSKFDEQWYLSYYIDVGQRVTAGDVFCGFIHFLLYGSRKGYLPRYNRERMIDRTFRGLINPERFAAADELRKLLRRPTFEVAPNSPPMLFVIVPTLQPEVMFAGYHAFFNFLHGLKRLLDRNGMAISFVTYGEELPNALLGRAKTDEVFDVLEGARFFNKRSKLVIGPRDRFIAYSLWDAEFASVLAAATDEKRTISFIQEYEPVFFCHSSAYAILRGALAVPSYPIFNSEFLKEYFRIQKLGVFQQEPEAPVWESYAWFTHAIIMPNVPTVEDLRRRRKRRLAVYARPEVHAARNLYEIAELALRQLSGTGSTLDGWEIVAVGSLTSLPDRDLGSGRSISFIPKMSLEEYRDFLPSIDVGVSLMYAPHPSVVPYEMAAAGAMVVTNTFDMRPAEFWTKSSKNFIVGEPTINGIADAIREAVRLSSDFERRVSNAYRSPTKGWNEVFDGRFIERTVGHVLISDTVDARERNFVGA